MRQDPGRSTHICICTYLICRLALPVRVFAKVGSKSMEVWPLEEDSGRPLISPLFPASRSASTLSAKGRAWQAPAFPDRDATPQGTSTGWRHCQPQTCHHRPRPRVVQVESVFHGALRHHTQSMATVPSNVASRAIILMLGTYFSCLNHIPERNVPRAPHA